MSQENVELVRSICKAWEHGDFRSAAWAHPEIEFERADESQLLRWSGLAGLAEGWRDFLNAWDGFRVRVDEYRQIDSERVIVFTHQSGRGKTSGLDLGQAQSKGACLFHVRGGKVTRLVVFTSHEQALIAAGLSE
jgi:ketosteroid isomerase-like protein